MLDPSASVQDVIDSLVSRLDAAQRRAFYEKMAELDDARGVDAAGARRRRAARDGISIHAASSRYPGWLS